MALEVYASSNDADPSKTIANPFVPNENLPYVLEITHRGGAVMVTFGDIEYIVLCGPDQRQDDFFYTVKRDGQILCRENIHVSECRGVQVAVDSQQPIPGLFPGVFAAAWILVYRK